MPRLSRVVEDCPQAMSIRQNMEVYALQERGVDVTVMSLGEAFFDLPLWGLDDLPFPDLYHYSSSRGTPGLRRRLATYLNVEHAIAVNADRELVVTAGSKAAIYMTLLSILDPGDEVLFAEPAWVSYPEQIRLCYGVPAPMPIGSRPDDYERFVTERTKAVIVNNPHNPTGRVMPREEIASLLAFAEAHDLWVLSDEAYSAFAPHGTFVSVLHLDPDKRRTVVFNSISKNHGISGWRIGYAVGSEDLIAGVLKVNQHVVTCAPTVLQHYVDRHFDEILDVTRPQIEELLERRRSLSAYMREIGLDRLEGDATFYFFLSIRPSRLGSEAFSARLLLDDHVSVVPGIGYGAGCDGFVRASIGTASLDENRRGLRAIKALIDATT